MKSLFCALLLLSTPLAAAETPEETQNAAKAPAKGNGPDKAGEKKDFDPAELMAVFEKMFPPQPDPAPQLLALSRVSVQALFPDGTYASLMDDLVGDMVDRVMGLSEADFGGKGKGGKPASKETLRQAAIKDDPHFEERMRILQRIATEELTKIAAIVEPKLREGLSRSMARRFDAKQLTDLNAFLATDSGRAFGRKSMAMWADPDVIRSMVGSFPEIIAALPAAMKRIETETAHLPKKEKPEPKEDTEEAE